MQKLMYSKSKNKYYYVCSENDMLVKCVSCNNVIELYDLFFIHKSYSKRENSVEMYCLECIKNHKKRIYDEFFVVEMISHIPPKCMVVSDSPPSLKTATTVFDAALCNKNIYSDCSIAEVIDHTKLANKTELQVLDMTDGHDESKLLEKKFESPDDVGAYLEMFK